MIVFVFLLRETKKIAETKIYSYWSARIKFLDIGQQGVGLNNNQSCKVHAKSDFARDFLTLLPPGLCSA